MKVEIRVTQKDIDNGVIDNCDACAVARAIRRRVLPSVSASVTGDLLHLRTVEDHDAACLPEEAKAFIRAFDRNMVVSPLRFTLDIPAKFLVKGVPGGRP